MKKNQNYIPLVLEWLKYKKEEKNQYYKTTRSLTAWIKKLIRFSGGDLKIAEEIIENSMANLWDGIFELKNNKSKPATIDLLLAMCHNSKNMGVFDDTTKNR